MDKLDAADKREIILRYVKDLGFKPVEISRATKLPFFAVNQMLQCETWPVKENYLDIVLAFLEGRMDKLPQPFCTGSGCLAMKSFIDSKESELRTLEETINMLREKIRRMEGK